MNLFKSSARNLKTLSISMVIALALVVVAGNVTASRSDGTSVTTCYNKKTGALRYLVKGTCKKTEQKLSIGQVGPQGPAGATGATGPAGPTGPAGVAQGVSAQDIWVNSQLSAGINTTGLRIGANPIGTLERSDDSLDLTTTKWIQATATVQIAGPVNTDADIDAGGVYCMIKRAPAGSPESSFEGFASTYIGTTEPKITETYYGAVTVTGGMQLTSGSWDFLVDCFYAGDLSVSYQAVSLNVVTVG